MNRGSVLLLVVALAGWVIAPAADAQSNAASLAPSATWTLDLPKTKPAPRRKAARPSAPAVSTADAERAARLAEARRKFFEDQNKPETPKPVPEFGGYDAATMSGTVQSGPGFKF